MLVDTALERAEGELSSAVSQPPGSYAVTSGRRARVNLLPPTSYLLLPPTSYLLLPPTSHLLPPTSLPTTTSVSGIFCPRAQERTAEAVLTGGFLFRQRYQYHSNAEGEASRSSKKRRRGEEGDGEGGGVAEEAEEESADDEEVRSAPKLNMTVERSLVLSHTRGVMSKEQYDMCLNAAQQAGVYTTAFNRHVMKRTTAALDEPVGSSTPALAEPSGHDSITQLLHDAKRKSEAVAN